MCSMIGGLVRGSAVLVLLTAPAAGQAVALPLRGEGELAVQDSVEDVQQGSVLLQADSTMKVVFVDTGRPRTVLAGVWRMADRNTAQLAVHAVLDGKHARGDGEIHFRPDGSVDRLAARGRAGDREFTLEFENAVGVAMAPTRPREHSSLQRATDDSFPWAGEWAVVDVTRHGDGRLTDAAGREHRFARTRLTLGDNDEFLLVVDGDSRMEFAGTWEGDPRDNPVRLQVREAMGQKMGGVGRVWLRPRSWDRDWSLQRVELDGWTDQGGDAFTLYFGADAP